MKEVQRSQTASIYNMENQIKLLAKLIAERVLGILPSELEQTLREQVEAVTLHNIQDQEVKSSMIID